MKRSTAGSGGGNDDGAAYVDARYGTGTGIGGGGGGAVHDKDDVLLLNDAGGRCMMMRENGGVEGR